MQSVGFWALALLVLAVPVQAVALSAVLFPTDSTPTAFSIRLETKRFMADETWYVDGTCLGRMISGPVVSVQINQVIADFSVYLARSRLGATRVVCLANPDSLPPALRRALPAN